MEHDWSRSPYAWSHYRRERVREHCRSHECAKPINSGYHASALRTPQVKHQRKNPPLAGLFLSCAMSSYELHRWNLIAARKPADL